MFNWFKSVGNFFKKLFGKSGDVVQVVLHDVSAFVIAAEPIVEQVALIASLASGKSELMAKLVGWLHEYEKDAAVVKAWVDAAEGMPSSDVLRSAGVLAVSKLVPEGTSKSLLNLAVEMAYNVYKRSKAGK